MWYTGLVLSTAGLGGSTAGSGVQGECRFSINCPGLEGSNAGSRHRVVIAVLYCMAELHRGCIGASLAETHTGSFLSISSQNGYAERRRRYPD